MILDILPYKTPKNHERIKNLGLLRYIVFILTFTLVITLFYLNIPNLNQVMFIMFIMFIIGNLLYYTIGILLAYSLKDNRAFCKYICPITTFLKPVRFFSLLRIKNNSTSCNQYFSCINKCPMDVDILNNQRKRKNGTECILCLECIKNCPTNSLTV